MGRGLQRRSVTLLLGTLLLGATFLGIPLAGGTAWAEDLPAYGPTSIAVPADWATRGAATSPRLVRQPLVQPLAVQPRALPVVQGLATPRRRPYHILRDAWRPRGPVEVRDEWILAQPRMTLPAVSPDALPHGSWTFEVYINRGSDFGFDQDGPAEFPTDRRFLVDGEHQTTELRARYGLFPRLSLGIRVPVYWRGGGFMDSIIDHFHDAFKDIGFLDNGRPAFLQDQYRVEGRDDAGTQLSWEGKRGTALGNIELEAHWNIHKAYCRSDWRTAWIVRAALPTGGDPYDSGFDLGTQFVVAKQLGKRMDFYAGVGGTWFSDESLDGIEYEPFRGHGFFALEYAVTSCWSFVVETNAASRLVTNLANYPELSWYINVSTRFDLSRRSELYLGFTENLADQQGTVDFGVFGGFTFRL